MPSNHLEQLVAEWYDYQGYFVRRNVLVGKRPNGGYECELDVVAFHPKHKRLVQVEASGDADSWEKREERFAKKFQAGRKFIPGLFDGQQLPPTIEQVALFTLASKKSRQTVGGGRIMLASEILREVRDGLAPRSFLKAAVSENLPLLRTIQMMNEFLGTGLAHR